MAARAGEPSPGASPTVIPRSGAIETKQATSKAVHDPLEGTHHVVTLPSGAVHKIQRLNSTESMGVPGFHVISDKEGWRGSVPTYMGDTKQEAIQALQEREAKKGSPAKKTHEEEAAEWRAGIAAKKAAGEIKDGGSHVVYKRTPQGTRYLAPDGRWITYTGGTQGMSASDAAELARKHPGANYRPVKHRDY